MSLYKHILIATDFSRHCHEVSQVAQRIAEQNQALLSIVHIFENLPISDSINTPMTYDPDTSEELIRLSKTRLLNIAEKLEIPKERQWFDLGSPKLEIVRIAEENKIDLIVVGSHGRHGWALLLGSTANGVLHHAKCDVLAVRLKDD